LYVYEKELAMIHPRAYSGAYPSWIEVEGFKSIKNSARVQIRPLTLLAGANSSGKSSMFQPLLLLKQSMEVSYDPDPLLLNGPHVEFTSLDQFLSRARTKDGHAKKVSITFGNMKALSQELESKFVKIDVRLTFKRKSSKSERLSVKTLIRESDNLKWIEVGMNSQKELLDLMGLNESEVELHIWQKRLQTELGFFWSKDEKRPRKKKELPTAAPLEWLLNIFHLPGLRGHRDRKYPITRVTSNRFTSDSVVGPMTPYAAGLLLDWQRLLKSDTASATEKKDARKNLDQVNSGLASLGLTWKVLSESANAAEIELRVGRLSTCQRGGARDLVDIADVGFGLSQVLPVLVGLAAATKGQMVLIEQPELHLHPRAQLAMGGVLADAAKRGVIVVVETHSQLILRAIQTIVANGKLTPDQVGLHWCARNEETGWSTVTQADLQKDGSFGDWPVDFPDVFAMADQEFIDAVFGDGE
jgi:predicted ATPase